MKVPPTQGARREFEMELKIEVRWNSQRVEIEYFEHTQELSQSDPPVNWYSDHSVMNNKARLNESLFRCFYEKEVSASLGTELTTS